MKAVILTSDERNGTSKPMAQNEILGVKMTDYCITALKNSGLFSEILVTESINDITYGDEYIFVMKAIAPLVMPATIIASYKKHITGKNEDIKTKVFSFIKAGEFDEIFNTSDDGPNDNKEFLLVDNKIKLYEAQEIIKRRINEQHMLNGITIINPLHTYISPGVVIGEDTVIYPNTYIKGDTKIGKDCIIGPDCTLTDMDISDNVEIISSTAIDSSIGNNTHVGPYAYIRPNSRIGENVKIGDFVEVKNSLIGNNTKASHLTYIGDSIVGKNVNFGCGTVTVNYDGKKKFKTEISDNAFIGCNTNLVAPVKVGESAYTAAGSTVTEDVPDRALAVARKRQSNKLNWRKK